MKYTAAIERGMEIVNRNWQLIVIQVGAMVMSFMGFFVIVGIPLAIAFIIFGLDLTELPNLEEVFRVLKHPSEIVSRYFLLVLFVLSSVLFYVIAVLLFGLFLFGGSIGVICRSIEGSDQGFTMKYFLSEGRRLFLPLFWFTATIGLIFIIFGSVLGPLVALITYVVSLAKEHDATLALFLGAFFTLILALIVLILILTMLSITIYGTAIMALRGRGPFVSLKEAAAYLYTRADGFYLYCTVFLAYVFASFVIVFVSYLIGFIPLIGSLLAFVYQFAVYIAQSYLGLVMIATLFYYYYSTTQACPTAGKPMQETSASDSPVPLQETPLQGQAGQRET